MVMTSALMQALQGVELNQEFLEKLEQVLGASQDGEACLKVLQMFTVLEQAEADASQEVARIKENFGDTIESRGACVMILNDYLDVRRDALMEASRFLGFSTETVEAWNFFNWKRPPHTQDELDNLHLLVDDKRRALDALPVCRLLAEQKAAAAVH